jgi:hypothetical protein
MYPQGTNANFELLKQAANDPNDSSMDLSSSSTHMGRDVARDSNRDDSRSRLSQNSSYGSIPNYLSHVLGRDASDYLGSLNEKKVDYNSKSNPMVGNKRDASQIDSDSQYDINNRQLVSSSKQSTAAVNQSSTNPDDADKGNYMDITEYLNLPQTDAAKKLGIPTSTLSKRWKEAVVNRKWPYRTVAKLDKEIMTLLHNIPQGPEAPPLPAEIEASLGILLRKRQEELRTVVIRL